MEFKIGDSVVFKKDDQYMALKNGYVVDKPYEIKAISEAKDAIEIINEGGWGNWLLINRFEKVTKKQRIATLENEVAELLPLKNEVAELKLIVQQLRKPSTVVEEVLAQADAIIEFEGAQYKKVDREACEGDVAILREPAEETAYVKNNTPYKVVRGHNDKPYLIDSTVAYLYESFFGRSSETVDVYELIEQPSSIVEDKPKSPNQLRAEVIEKAKGFVEDGAKVDLFLDRGRGYVVPFEKGDKESGYICEVQFEVNADKRTVVALLRWTTEWESEVKAKGIAKCMPGDVFNEHIGKAIALGRALGLDVSEFEGAVQPTVAVIGMKFIDRHGDTREIVGDGLFSRASMKSVIGSANVQDYPITIINDTNAIYGGVE